MKMTCKGVNPRYDENGKTQEDVVFSIDEGQSTSGSMAFRITDPASFGCYEVGKAYSISISDSEPKEESAVPTQPSAERPDIQQSPEDDQPMQRALSIEGEEVQHHSV
jgi:hypothetical protein